MRGRDLVFFDLGSVVCRFYPERRLAAIRAATGLDEREIHERIWGSGLDDRMDRGRYSLDEACHTPSRTRWAVRSRRRRC